jgi:hypothetical protein
MVLLILGVLMQASIAPLGQKLRYQKQSTAQDELKQITDSLKAHWVTNGYLPCPVTAKETVSPSNNVCLVAEGGVPVMALGLTGPMDDRGALLDPWNQPYRYRVSLHDADNETKPNSPDWVTPGEITRVPFTELQADLTVCRAVTHTSCSIVGASAGASAGASRVSASQTLAGDMVAVVMASGAQQLPTEIENRDGDDAFISAALSDVPQHAFDDQLMWVTRSELIYLALQSGWL